MPEVFRILENDEDVWERDRDGCAWAIRYDRAVKDLKDAGIKGIEDKINVVADYYMLDIDDTI